MGFPAALRTRHQEHRQTFSSRQNVDYSPSINDPAFPVLAKPVTVVAEAASSAMVFLEALERQRDAALAPAALADKLTIRCPLNEKHSVDGCADMAIEPTFFAARRGEMSISIVRRLKSTSAD